MNSILLLFPFFAVVLNVFLVAYLQAQRPKTACVRQFILYAAFTGVTHIVEYLVYGVLTGQAQIVAVYMTGVLVFVLDGLFMAFCYAYLGKPIDRTFIALCGLLGVGAILSLLSSFRVVVLSSDPTIVYISMSPRYTVAILIGIIPVTFNSLWKFIEALRQTTDQVQRNRIFHLLIGMGMATLIAIVIILVLPVLLKVEAASRFASIATILQFGSIFRSVMANRFLTINSRDFEAAALGLFAEVQEGVLILDNRGAVIMANRSAKRILGGAAHASSRQELERRIPGYSFDASYHDREFSVIHETVNRVVSLSQSTVRDATISLGKILIIHDLTEEQRLQDELARARQFESLGVLAGGIAHDFNNFLAGMMGNISLIRTSLPPTAPEVELAREAEQAGRNAAQLVAQLLTFARGGAPTKESVSVREMIEETTSFALRGRAVTCTVECSPDLAFIHADKGQISQVLHNLILNACAAMPAEGNIAVVASNRLVKEPNDLGLGAGEYVQITVRDSGCGMSREVLKKIFEPFFTTKKEGRGLGLSMAYSIIKKHKGAISVDSTPGVGSVFTIVLPATREAPKVASEPTQPVKSAVGRILCMDDDPVVRLALGKMLARMGYMVDTAADGREALTLFDRQRSLGEPYSIIITDLTVPGGMGGVELAQKIRLRDPEAKIVVTSGYSDAGEIADYAAFGFTARLAKPFSFEALSKVLGTLSLRSTSN